MGKVTLLFAGKSYDTDVQNVRENQIVIFDGPYNMRQRMVVAGIAHTQSGYNYRLIDPETAEEHSADLIRPLRDKFGIGHYYDDEHPEFMDAAEVAALLKGNTCGRRSTSCADQLACAIQEAQG